MSEPSPVPRDSDIFRTAVLFEGGLAIAAVAIGWLVRVDPLARFPDNAGQLAHHGWAAMVGLAATLPMLAGMLLVDRWPIGPLRRLQGVVDELLVPLFRGMTLGRLALISVMAGLGEELLFRGLLQDGLAQWTGSPAIGLAVASLLFGLAHYVTRTYAVLAGLTGVWLGILMIAANSIVCPMVAHAAYDFAALVYLTRTRSTKEEPDDSNSAAVSHRASESD